MRSYLRTCVHICVYARIYAYMRANISVDGGIGPNTLKAIDKLELERARAFRVKYYSDLCSAKPTLLKYYYGWFRRSLEV